MQIREPASALRHFLRFVIEITKHCEHFRALLERLPHFFAQRFDPSRGAFVVFGGRVKLPEHFGAAPFVREFGGRRFSIESSMIFQRVGFFGVSVAQSWLGNRELAAAFANLFKGAFDIFFAQTIDGRITRPIRSCGKLALLPSSRNRARFRRAFQSPSRAGDPNDRRRQRAPGLQLRSSQR